MQERGSSDMKAHLIPSDLSTLKDTIRDLLQTIRNIVCQLLSASSPFGAPSFSNASGFSLQDLAAHHSNYVDRVDRGFRNLNFNLDLLLGCCNVLCNPTAESASTDSLPSSNEEEELLLLQRIIQQLEEMVASKLMGLQSQESHLKKEREKSAQALQHYNREVVRPSEQVEFYKQQFKALQAKMERAETFQAQKSLVESGSYEDSIATPLLLQAAADSVKEAIAVCASALFSTTKNHSISLQASELGFSDDASSATKSPYITKVALQAFLCQVFFMGFDDPFFSMNSRSLPPFEKPEKQRRGKMQSYKKYPDSTPEVMFSQIAAFTHFLNARMPAFNARLRSLLFKRDVEPDQVHAVFVSEFFKKPDSSVYTSLLRLGKAVWLLQKLAFAMEPNAKIFHVAQRSIFKEEFMEDLMPAEVFDFDHDGDCGALEGAKEVSFMCVPGLMVGRTIIKARVMCSQDLIRRPSA